MAFKAYDRMRIDNLKPNLREYVHYLTNTVSVCLSLELNRFHNVILAILKSISTSKN